MSSKPHTSGWISTARTPRTASKRKKTNLVQASLLDFLQKPQPTTKHRRLPDENRRPDALSIPLKRSSTTIDDRSVLSQRKRKKSNQSFPSQQYTITTVKSKDLPGTISTPIIVPDSPPDLFYDRSTDWNSASSLRTLRDEPRITGGMYHTPGTFDYSPSPANGEKTYPAASPSNIGSNQSCLKIFVHSRSPAFPPPRSRLEDDSVVPSSQAEETNLVLPQSDDTEFAAPPLLARFFGGSHMPDTTMATSNPHASVEEDNDKPEDYVPSSQSQYLLPCETTPPSPICCNRYTPPDDRIVPSSQSQVDTDLVQWQNRRSEPPRRLPSLFEPMVIEEGISERSEEQQDEEQANDLERLTVDPDSSRAFSSRDSDDTSLIDAPLVHELEDSNAQTIPSSPLADLDTRGSSYTYFGGTCPQSLLNAFNDLDELPDTYEGDGPELQINQSLSVGPGEESEGTEPMDLSLASKPGSQTRPSLCPAGEDESQFTYLGETCPAEALEFLESMETSAGLDEDDKVEEENEVTIVPTSPKISALNSHPETEVSAAEPLHSDLNSLVQNDSQYSYFEETIPPQYADFFSNGSDHESLS